MTGAGACGVVRTKALTPHNSLAGAPELSHRTEIGLDPARKAGTSLTPGRQSGAGLRRFRKAPNGPVDSQKLCSCLPDANIAPESVALQRIIDGVPALMPHLESAARSRAAELLEAHRRVRSAARLRGVSQKVEPQLPPDILGIYVFLPVPASGGQA